MYRLHAGLSAFVYIALTTLKTTATLVAYTDWLCLAGILQSVHHSLKQNMAFMSFFSFVNVTVYTPNSSVRLQQIVPRQPVCTRVLRDLWSTHILWSNAKHGYHQLAFMVQLKSLSIPKQGCHILRAFVLFLQQNLIEYIMQAQIGIASYFLASKMYGITICILLTVSWTALLITALPTYTVSDTKLLLIAIPF